MGVGGHYDGHTDYVGSDACCSGTFNSNHKGETMIGQNYDLSEDELDKRILTPNPTKAMVLAGYKYSIRKDIQERVRYAWFRLCWRLKWGVALFRYGDRLLGFSDGSVLLRKEE